MGQEGYGIALHSREDLTDGYSLTEAVTKCAERTTQAEECMAQMEDNFKEKFAMVSMQQLPHTTYYQNPPTPPTPHT